MKWSKTRNAEHIQKGNKVTWRDGGKKGTGVVLRVISSVNVALGYSIAQENEFVILDDETGTEMTFGVLKIEKVNSKAKIAREKKNAEIVKKIGYIED